MLEHQTIEWKSSWDDEYLKWICGYANAYGGTLFIGKEDNTGEVIGISNARELLKKLPDKITNTMGIIADVNLNKEGRREYLEISVEKYPSLISLRGKYYYRSGSTMRTITGVELEKMLLKSHGRSWDGVPLPRVFIEDLSQAAIDLFKEKAVASDRLTQEDVDVENRILLENLHLFDDENLVRAAVMAFYKDLEKWFFGSYIKIGYFVTDANLRYMDEVHGPLIAQVDKAIELIYTKYMKALIYYEGTQRYEKYMFPKVAFKEILTNAVCHKDYSSCIPIQISVYDDKIYVYNSGTMPPELSSTKELFEKHSSKPHNPKLAHVFFKSGMIESWGRGFETIRDECEKHGTALPEYNIMNDGVMVLCKPNERYVELLNGGGVEKNNKLSIPSDTKRHSSDIQATPNGAKRHSSDRKSAIIAYFTTHEKLTTPEVATFLGVKNSWARTILRNMVSDGIVEKIGDDRYAYYVLK